MLRRIFIQTALLQVNFYLQSHIQINEYRDRVILVSIFQDGFHP